MLLNITKSVIRNAISTLYDISGFSKKIHNGNLLILTYHRILPQAEIGTSLVQPGMYVENNTFKKHIKFLKKNYDIISFHEYFNRNTKNDWDIEKQYCIISFDDGWRDNYTYAFPILKRHSIPATVFPAADFVGTTDMFWPERFATIFEQSEKMQFDDYYQLLIQAANYAQLKSVIPLKYLKNKSGCSKQLNFNFLVEIIKTNHPDLIFKFLEKADALFKIRPSTQRLILNWEEIKEMSDNGISFGSHGCTHRILTYLSPKEIRQELVKSKMILSEKKIDYVPVFSYPNGSYNRNILEAVLKCGYKAAVTTKYGITNLFRPIDQASLNRIGVHNDISKSSSIFSFHLSGFAKKFSKQITS